MKASKIIEVHKSNSTSLVSSLQKIYTLLPQKHSEAKIQSELNFAITGFLDILKEFPSNRLPYSAISTFVFTTNDAGVGEFFNLLDEEISTFDLDEDTVTKYIRLSEHFELARSQKELLFIEQKDEIEKISYNITYLENAVAQFESSKEEIELRIVFLTDLNEKIKSKQIEVEKDFQKIESKTDQLTVNLISILGIFAAILLGAYGSIQGFTNLFTNADKLSMGKIIMISSIGGSSVLLILFFLLSSVARLTGRNFGNGGTDFMSKHPIMMYSHCVLLFLFTLGGTFEIIDNSLNPNIYWFWILIPILLLIHIFKTLTYKSPWGILYTFKTTGKIKREVFMMYVILTLLIVILYILYV